MNCSFSSIGMHDESDSRQSTKQQNFTCFKTPHLATKARGSSWKDESQTLVSCMTYLSREREQRSILLKLFRQHSRRPETFLG
jgi:hypothetical protein